MSDQIKHECGIAVIRLRKPLQYYIDKYGTPTYASRKLYLLMEKQHNRGQDGVGVANVKVDVPVGVPYMYRQRSTDDKPLAEVFRKVNKKFRKAKESLGEQFYDAEYLKSHVPYTGEVWLGHLRYGTHGGNTIEQCHPFVRENNWRSRTLAVAGNFNMTNTDYLFDILVKIGQHPKDRADTVTVMEKIGHFLDQENQALFDKYKYDYNNQEISEIIEKELDLHRVLIRACKDFDGGYAMAGLTGYGAAFVARDPAGIRPAYYYADEEVVVVASEKPAIKTAFNIDYNQIKEITPGHALIIERDGSYAERQFIDQLPKSSCSFERIYFSRGTDPDIYQERKALGRLLVPQVLKSVDYDLKNTVFSFIPNTAEVSFLGMIDGMEQYLAGERSKVLKNPDKLSEEELLRLLSFRPRIEKLVIKDAKLRTFITDDEHRDELVSHVYDTTYEVIRKGVDTLVVIDDSIVRGTTLEKSILTMLDRLEPKKIIIVSSAPQIRYPDCYGIDMSRLKDFIAFRAALALLKESGQEEILDQVYEQCVASVNNPDAPNYVQGVYAPFTDEQISQKIADLIKTDKIRAEVEVIYQTVENLHQAIPKHSGDWYFTGNFPTRGGNAVVNRAFRNFMEGKLVRAY